MASADCRQGLKVSMVLIDFVVPDVDSVLGRSWHKALAEDAHSIKAVALHYTLFYSQVEFSVGGVRFMSKSSFVPLIDLARGMSGVVDRLTENRHGALDFTEHDEVIDFVVSGANVTGEGSDTKAARRGLGQLTELVRPLNSLAAWRSPSYLCLTTR